MEEKKGKAVTKILFLVLAMVVILLGVYSSYAYINYKASLSGEEVNSITTCAIKLDLKDENPISLNNTYPMEDDVASRLNPYVVTVSKDNSNCDKLLYVLNFSLLNNSQYMLNPNMIKYQVVNENTKEIINGVNPLEMNIKGEISTGDVTYSIRFWISALASNDDIYVVTEDGYLTADDGMYITRSFSAKAVATLDF